MDDGFKTPQWSEKRIDIPVRLLQECAMALSPTRGLIQRLECHEHLDARDQKALAWGREAYAKLLVVLLPTLTPEP